MMTKSEFNAPLATKLYKDGNSFRFVKSPDAPNITIEQGPAGSTARRLDGNPSLGELPSTLLATKISRVLPHSFAASPNAI